jgi:hypothetical protein
VTTYHVHLFHRHVSRRGGGRWAAAIDVTADPPIPTDATIATFAVDVPHRGDAAAVAMEWLTRGEPSSMTVRRTYPRGEPR